MEFWSDGFSDHSNTPLFQYSVSLITPLLQYSNRVFLTPPLQYSNPFLSLNFT
jgi:hypothetical protein